MISQTAEYALRVVVCLANRPEESLTNEQISEQTKVPLGYLAKLMQVLRKEELVDSRRGIHGGFTLKKDPGRLSVLDVINAVDPLKRIRHCPLGLKAHGTHLCDLHRQLDDAQAQAEKAFRSHTIASLLVSSNPSVPLGL